MLCNRADRLLFLNFRTRYMCNMSPGQYLLPHHLTNQFSWSISPSPGLRLNPHCCHNKTMSCVQPRYCHHAQLFRSAGLLNMDHHKYCLNKWSQHYGYPPHQYPHRLSAQLPRAAQLWSNGQAVLIHHNKISALSCGLSYRRHKQNYLSGPVSQT